MEGCQPAYDLYAKVQTASGRKSATEQNDLSAYPPCQNTFSIVQLKLWQCAPCLLYLVGLLLSLISSAIMHGCPL